MGMHHFRRHTRASSISLDSRAFGSDLVRAEYVRRAQGHFNRVMQVVDFGLYAGQTTNACFWLCLAAGLSKGHWQVDAQALPGLVGIAGLLDEVRLLPLAFFDGGANVRQSPLGRLAEKLRTYMCAGPGAVLLRRDMLEKLFPAFAAIAAGSVRRELHHYKRWVQRLADREFADELVILAVTLELKVRIVCIPYTRPEAANEWAISTYAPPGDPVVTDIVVGNNDVHYMWLTP